MDARLPVRRSEVLEQSKQATEDDETAADDLALVHARPNSKLTGDEIDTDMARAVADSQDVECVSTGRPRLSIKLNRTLEQQVVPITVIEGRAEGLVSPEGFGFGLISVRFGGFPTCSASRKAIVSATQLGRPAPTCRALDLCRGRHTE